MSFGLTSARDVPAVNFAVQMAKKTFNESFQIVGRYSAVLQRMWSEVLDNCFTSVLGVKAEPVCLEEALNFATTLVCQ